MAAFDKEVLDSYKYADLVKLAKENGVYRRYAPKVELVEKLMALNDSPVETLSDVSMPSFTDDETDSENVIQDTENTSPHVVIDQFKKQKRKVVTFSPRPPLSEKRRFLNSSSTPSVIDNSATLSCKSDDSQLVRRSLAGPAKSSATGAKSAKSLESSVIELPSDPVPRRMTRQRTFDVETPQPVLDNKLKREGTFEVIKNSKEIKNGKQITPSGTMRREGTFEVDNLESNKKTPRATQSSTLRREGTFEVGGPKNSHNDLSNTKLRREGTFEVEVATTRLSEVKKPTSRSTNLRLTSNCVSETKKSTRGSLRTPHQSKRISIATPASVKTTFTNTNRNIASRSRTQDSTSSGNKFSGSKCKIPSRVNEIQRKKTEVSAQKMVDATVGFKPKLAKKVPDFSAIHNRLFDKMESIADSVQKVKEKAFSSQKHLVKSGKKSPPKAKVVRKLLSPKVGKTKHASPKPLFHSTASAFASKVVSIQKRPSNASLIPGVSKLQSPQPEKIRKGGVTNFGFIKAEPTRKDVLKASVMGRKPTKRNSPMSKAKQALNTVRLNKRFELQMKHRIAQQTNQQ